MILSLYFINKHSSYLLSFFPLFFLLVTVLLWAFTYFSTFLLFLNFWRVSVSWISHFFSFAPIDFLFIQSVPVWPSIINEYNSSNDASNTMSGGSTSNPKRSSSSENLVFGGASRNSLVLDSLDPWIGTQGTLAYRVSSYPTCSYQIIVLVVFF